MVIINDAAEFPRIKCKKKANWHLICAPIRLEQMLNTPINLLLTTIILGKVPKNNQSDMHYRADNF